MELTRRLKLFGVSAVILLLACLDSGVISAPITLEVDNDDIKGSIAVNVLCKACDAVASTLQKLIKTGVSETIIVKTAIELCDHFNIQDQYICENIVPEFKVRSLSCFLFPLVTSVFDIQNEVIDILADTALSSDEICGSILGTDCGSTYDPFNQTWTIPIPGNKPPVKIVTPNAVCCYY